MEDIDREVRVVRAAGHGERCGADRLRAPFRQQAASPALTSAAAAFTQAQRADEATRHGAA